MAFIKLFAVPSIPSDEPTRSVWARLLFNAHRPASQSPAVYSSNIVRYHIIPNSLDRTPQYLYHCWLFSWRWHSSDLLVLLPILRVTRCHAGVWRAGARRQDQLEEQDSIWHRGHFARASYQVDGAPETRR